MAHTRPCLSPGRHSQLDATSKNGNAKGNAMSSFETILVERPDPAIARIVMNRPEARNAQNLQMTYDLNAAFDAAVQDDAVKVIILAGNGPHFSSGHDLRPGGKNAAGVDFPPVGNWGGFAEPNAAWPLRARAGNISPDHTALAQPGQADHCRGARQVHRRRVDAGLGLRPHRRQRRCSVLRSRGDHGRLRGRMVRASLGARPAQGQGVPVHRRQLERAGGASARHGQPGRAARGAFSVGAGAGAPDRRQSRPSR